MMRKYETIFILHPSLDEEAVKANIEKFKGVIENRLKVDWILKKKKKKKWKDLCLFVYFFNNVTTDQPSGHKQKLIVQYYQGGKIRSGMKHRLLFQKEQLWT